MGFAPHATREDLIGVDGDRGYLSAKDAATAAQWELDECERVLERATELVDDLTGRALYEVDHEGKTVDENIAAALRMATCAVVEKWLEVGEENDIDGLDGDQISVPGFSGHRAPRSSNRVLRPLRRAGLLAQPQVSR